MSSTADRIQKFNDDAKSLLYIADTLSSSTSSPSFLPRDSLLKSSVIAKIIAEITRFRNWLQKHQTETVSDGSKSKILGTIDMYYRFYHHALIALPSQDAETVKVSINDAVQALVGDYLQMPEGKLVSGKDKRKALAWIEEMSRAMSKQSSTIEGVDTIKGHTQWILQGVNHDKTILLLNAADNETWKEDFKVPDSKQLKLIQKMQLEVSSSSGEGGDGEKMVVITLDERENVVDISLRDS